MKISITNGQVEYSGVPILSRIDFTVNDKDKIAIVGRNGCGKTTLLKAISKQVELIQGDGDEQMVFSVIGSPKIGYLEQINFDDENTTLYDEVISAYSNLLDLENKINIAQKKLETDQSPELIKSFSILSELYENEGGYTYKSEALTAINKFGFTKEELNKSLHEFSGGQRTKIALLKLILSKPDLLLLDEPTNHLDIDAIIWLENFLRNYKNAFIIVSHDRYFLDKIAKIIYEIEYGELNRYKGNYTSYVEQKQAKYEQELKDMSIKKKEIERLSKIVEKFRYKAGKAAMAQAKLTQIERIGTVTEPTKGDIKTLFLNYKVENMSVEKVLVCDNLSFGYTKELGNISFILKRGEKLGIIGPNGCGKSTLMKTLMDIVKPLGGEFNFGFNAKIGYFDQKLTENFSEDTVLEDFLKDFPQYDNTRARKILGSFMFVGEDVFKQVKDLSGGEKVRLALCKMLQTKPNVLLLDEPTNHIDLLGKSSFENLLKQYEGTVIVVSHDRYLINSVCQKLVVFENGKSIFFDGTYNEYIEKVSNQVDEEQKDNIKNNSKEEKQITNNQPQNDYFKNKEIKSLKLKISTIEKKISNLENDIEECNNQINLHQDDYKIILQEQEKITNIEKEIDDYFLKYEELSKRLSELETN
ncbi:MAG: ATP-binding cassette domain-containing protein [Clostridia bacterium]|nr:ATP-binding cassette domain-containing protein [Clostridia bacterium]